VRKTDKIKNLYIINTGILSNSKLLNIKSYSESSLPVFAYLIQHENKWVLFDTGLSSKLAENPENYLGFILDSVVPFRTRVEWILSSQIKNITLNEIDVVILSHRHFDHTGEVSEFLNTKIYIHKDEMKSKITMLGSLRGIKTSDIPKETSLTFPEFKKIKNPWGMKQLIDLFEDNSLFITYTPGHVMGHISVVLNGEIPIFLAGDALYSPPSNYTNKKVTKYWDMLSTIYYFRKKGLIFTSHDKLHLNKIEKYDWITVKDPPNNAFGSSELHNFDEDSII
jgi:glyoxylase-like metal-dependent hydrolase (beta-lactamase superfamily II)